MGKRPSRRAARGSGWSVYPNANSTFTGAVQISSSPRRWKKKNFPDRAAAEQWCQEQLALIDRGIDLTQGAKTLTEMALVWLNDVKAPKGLAPTTLANYRLRLEHWILPYLGERRLGDIRPEHIQRWVNDLRARDLASSTIADVFDVLSGIFDQAVSWKYLADNPCSGVERPTPTVEEREPFTLEELAAFFTPAETHRLSAAFWLLAVLGLRRGELLGLRWSDVGWERAELTIGRQVQYISEDVEAEDGTLARHYQLYELDRTKTRAGRRVVPLTPALIERLRAWRATQREEYTYLGLPIPIDGLIFTNEHARPFIPINFSGIFTRLRTAAGLGQARTLHIFRHTANSLMADAGVVDAVRAELFGWSKKGIIGRYTHSSMEAKRRAVEGVERQIRAAIEERQRRERTG